MPACKVKAGPRTGRRVGFPRFKRRKHEQGFRTDNGPATVKVDGKTATRPIFGRTAVVETLSVAGMMMNHRLARAIADAGMSGFLSKLEYKCSWYGAEFEKADRWFASSKLCSHCGWKNDEPTLSDREWWCGGCGVLNDRDANAAMNLANRPGLSFPVTGREDRVSPAAPAVVGETSNEPEFTGCPVERLEQINRIRFGSQ